MFLDNRKKNILKAVIDDYIETAEPIGSRTVARKHELGLSSATIRNEMSDLEEMGLLVQPHTSAGRIPSDRGYRLYVDELMKIHKLSIEDLESIREAMETRINELGQLMRQASAIMSRITKYTSMAITPSVSESHIKAVQIVPIDNQKALVIVVSNTGVVKNSIISISRPITPDYMIKISNVFNAKLSGLNAGRIGQGIVRELEKEMNEEKDLLDSIMKGIGECLYQIEDSEVYLDGATNIFNYPEFSDIIKAKEFLNILDAKDLITRILSKCNDSEDIKVKIGVENEIQEVKDYSLITVTCRVNNEILGSMGVIGPTRMEYSRVISTLNYIRNLINRDLKRILGEECELK